MNVKEKLVELLDNAFIDSDDNYGLPNTNQVADHLIARGVTLQKWISVDDRLPEFCVSVLARCFYHGKWRTLVCHTSKEHAGEWYTDEVCQWVKVTHWMPLPLELQKGE